MRTVKRTEITVETDEITIIRGPQSGSVTLCQDCLDAVVMITLDQAAVMARAKTREIYRLIEEDRVHYAETPEGSLLVCPRSVWRLTAGALPPRELTSERNPESGDDTGDVPKGRLTVARQFRDLSKPS